MSSFVQINNFFTSQAADENMKITITSGSQKRLDAVIKRNEPSLVFIKNTTLYLIICVGNILLYYWTLN